MSFVIEGQENEAVAHHLDRHGIAVRSGNHCALPALRRFGVDQSIRASLAFYDIREDVFPKALQRPQSALRRSGNRFVAKARGKTNAWSRARH